MMVMASFVAFCESLGEKSKFPRYMYIVDGEDEGWFIQIHRADKRHKYVP
jgi:hypothetical protein